MLFSETVKKWIPIILVAVLVAITATSVLGFVFEHGKRKVAEAERDLAISNARALQDVIDERNLAEKRLREEKRRIEAEFKGVTDELDKLINRPNDPDSPPPPPPGVEYDALWDAYDAATGVKK